MEIVVLKELLGHAHVGVTTVHAHVRLRLHRDAIDLPRPATPPGDSDEPPFVGTAVR